MTYRQRILSAIKGTMPDRIPFVPRLDFWYRARRYANNFPTGWNSPSLADIAKRLGVGVYATVPDFSDHSADDNMLDHGLGILKLPVLTYRVSLEGVERRVLREGMTTTVEYDTPAGSIRTTMVFTEEMLAGGCSSPNFTRYAIQDPKDFEAVGYVFDHLKVEPQTEGYRKACEQVGDRGIVVAMTVGTACPMQHIMMCLMGVENFTYAMQDYPSKIETLAEKMEPFYNGIKSVAAESSAEVVMLGGNYDDSITHPAFFRRYILPSLRDYAALLHGKNKYLMTHTDGENRLLLPLYLEAGFDVADSVCPYPMTRCTLEEIRKAFSDRITIWGGVPSTILCAHSASWEEFRQFIDEVIGRYGHDSHFVLGVADMVPAEAEWDRVQYIAEKVSSLS